MLADAFLYLLFAIPTVVLGIMSWLSKFFGVDAVPGPIGTFLIQFAQVLKFTDAFCPAATPCSTQFLTFLVGAFNIVIFLVFGKLLLLFLGAIRGTKLGS